MGASKKLFETTFVTCVMPHETYKDIKDKNGVKKISVSDISMYEHYKSNIDWQEIDHLYKYARNRKNKIESDIEFKMLKNK